MTFAVFIHPASLLSLSLSNTRHKTFHAAYPPHNRIFLPAPVLAIPLRSPISFPPPSPTEHYWRSCGDFLGRLRGSLLSCHRCGRGEPLMRWDQVELRGGSFRPAAPPPRSRQPLVSVRFVDESCRIAECFHQGNGVHVILHGWELLLGAGRRQQQLSRGAEVAKLIITRGAE